MKKFSAEEVREGIRRWMCPGELIPLSEVREMLEAFAELLKVIKSEERKRTYGYDPEDYIKSIRKINKAAGVE